MSRREEITGGGLAAGPARAVLTTGQPYVDARQAQFKGQGVMRSCIRCNKHRPSAGGRMVKRGGAAALALRGLCAGAAA